MDNESIMGKDKIGLCGILRESFSIPAKNLKFLVFSLFTSFPLFLSLLVFEVLFQETLFMSISTFLSDDSPDTASCDGGLCIKTVSVSPWDPFESTMNVISKHSHRFVLLCLTYLILVHPPEIINSISILRHSSAIYAGDDVKQSFGKFSLRLMKDLSLKGPSITSLYALSLTMLVTFGLIGFGMEFLQFYPWLQDAALGTVVVLLLPFLLVFGGLFSALLIKYIEWSSVWNVGIAISVLEEKHGDIAIWSAAYLSRGSRVRGFLLMLVFFLWKLCLRSLCLYLVWGERWGRGRSAATVAQVLGIWLGNLVKWVVIMVYYCDCKRRFLEKKIDMENGKLVVP